MPPAVSNLQTGTGCVPQRWAGGRLRMLADEVDFVVGVDPHRDSHALAVVEVVSGAVVFETTVVANSDGYAHALALVEEHAAGRRVLAIEGTGSFGAGLTRFLTRRGERVLEVGRLHRERRSGGKTDALDAVRAARSVLAQRRPATPRAGGERQALQALVAAREGAVNAKRAGLDRPAGAAADRRGTRTRPRDRNDHSQARAAAARPARCWSARRRTARPVLVTPRTDRGGSRIRATRRRSADTRLLRPDSPLPARPKRRPQTEPRPPHDPRHTKALTPRDDRLHRPSHPRRQESTRSDPLPQALPRPQPLPAPRTRTAAGDLTNIEASLAQSSMIFSQNGIDKEERKWRERSQVEIAQSARVAVPLCSRAPPPASRSVSRRWLPPPCLSSFSRGPSRRGPCLVGSDSEI